MRAIFVSHCHPDCPHVCGTRAREFAFELSRQGHFIVLLTETLSRLDAALDASVLPATLAEHDWSQPFRLAVPPRRAPILEALRAGRLPALLRLPVIAYQYGVRGGMFTDWRDASRPYWKILASEFRPDIVWAVFGNTDCWAIAQGIARLAHRPWVRDFKDQWTAFIPALLRDTLARRFLDAAATTALSAANAADAAPWFPGPTQVIYSGAPDNLATPPVPQTDAGLRIVLVGGLYEQLHLATLIDGVRRYASAPGRVKPMLIYIGTDGSQFAAAADCLKGVVDTEIRGQLPFKDYWRLIAGSDVNCYIRTEKKGSWHHKIVELLTARRPILCVPGEIDEARSLADQVEGSLLAASDPTAVSAALDHLGKERGVLVGNSAKLRHLAWSRRSGDLLAALMRAQGVGG